MSFARTFVIVAIVIFVSIGAAAYLKKSKVSSPLQSDKVSTTKPKTAYANGAIEIDLKAITAPKQPQKEPPQSPLLPKSNKQAPVVDRIELLFQKDSALPIVETIEYKSRVPWKKGKTALLYDYAQHYNTPLDFVLRSVYGKTGDSHTPIHDGVQLNVLKLDKDFSFYLVIDISRCKLWLYYLDPESQEHFLLKTYSVGLGKKDPDKTSGLLTPIGTYSLGKRVAIYKPRMMGRYKNQRVELITVFGTRWIPFEKEIKDCSEPAKGFGIHGTPWIRDENDKLSDDTSSIGDYYSAGCIRLKSFDIEELYSIISSRDAVVEIVRDFNDVVVPYKEKG